MKKIANYILTTCTFLIGMSGCDKGFDEMNINPVQPIAVDPVYVMNEAIILSSHAGQTLVYELAIVQQLISPNSGVLAGGNYNQDNRPVTLGNWNKFNRDVLKHVADVLEMTRDDAERSNLYNMARILRSYGAMVLTDTYGEVPYFEASLGYLEGIVSPAYDTQESIYQDILTNLEQATSALDANKPTEAGEVLYGGDIEKWKKFGYSLMLRAAMRHSKVNPTKAQEFVSKAITGGVFQSNADNAVIRHTPNYPFALGNTLNSTERANYFLAEPFVKFLQDNDDPRLASIAVRTIGATSGADQDGALAGTATNVTLSRDPEDQVGFPMGYDNASIVPVAVNLGVGSFYAFSQADRTRMASAFAPAFLVTYSQTLLLLAEAAERNWAALDASELYSQGIRAHMEELAAYGSSVAIDPADIETYVQANPLDTSNALEEINTQYWVSSFLNGAEAFANFRRSGYPALAPNPFPGKEISGDFIRRLTYPDAELSVNTENLQQSLSRQGQDLLDTRVWWDQP